MLRLDEYRVSPMKVNILLHYIDNLMMFLGLNTKKINCFLSHMTGSSA
jgi:hypothetical protein